MYDQDHSINLVIIDIAFRITPFIRTDLFIKLSTTHNESKLIKWASKHSLIVLESLT